MDAADYRSLYANDPEYRTWFRNWWKKDFSNSGAGAKEFPLDAILRDPTYQFAGREWHALRLPPHDDKGRINPQFDGRRLLNLQRWLNQAAQQRAGAPLAIIGAFLTELECQSWCPPELELSHSAVAAATLPARGRPLRIRGSHSFVSGRWRIDKCSHLEITLQESLVHFLTDRVDVGNVTLSFRQCIITHDASLLQSTRSLKLIESTIHPDISCVLDVRDIFDLNATTFHGNASFTTNGDGQRISVQNAKFGGNLVLTIRSGSGGTFSADTVAVSGNFSLHCTSTLATVTVSNFECNGLFHVYCSCDSVYCDKLSTNRSLQLTGSDIRAVTLSNCRAVEGIIVDKIRLSTLEIRDCESQRDIKIWSCEIGHKIRLQDVSVDGSIDFNSTTIFGQCTVMCCTASAGIDFEVVPNDSTRKRPSETSINGLSLEKCNLSDREYSGNFALNLSNRRIIGIFSVVNCNIYGPMKMDNVAFSGEVVVRATVFPLNLPPGSKPIAFGFLPFLEGPSSKEALAKRNSAAHQFERGFAHFKNALKVAGNDRIEREFHVREMRARRMRRESDVGFMETTFSLIYDVLGEYGESISKPLQWIAVTLLSFSVTYFILSGEYHLADIPYSIDFSLQQLLRPMSIWSLNVDDHPTVWVKRLFVPWEPLQRPWWEIWIKVVASAESLLALLLAFITALAVRRKFSMA